MKLIDAQKYQTILKIQLKVEQRRRRIDEYDSWHVLLLLLSLIFSFRLIPNQERTELDYIGMNERVVVAVAIFCWFVILIRGGAHILRSLLRQSSFLLFILSHTTFANARLNALHEINAHFVWFYIFFSVFFFLVIYFIDDDAMLLVSYVALWPSSLSSSLLLLLQQLLLFM